MKGEGGSSPMWKSTQKIRKLKLEPTDVILSSPAMWTHVDRGAEIKNLIFVDVINGLLLMLNSSFLTARARAKKLYLELIVDAIFRGPDWVLNMLTFHIW